MTPEAFGTALKEVHQFQSSTSTVDLDRLCQRLSSSLIKQPSPAPSLSSCNSSDSSKEGDISTGKHFDPDVESAGTMADVDSSDANRQNSIEEEPKMSGIRRTLDNFFGLSKSKPNRKSPETESSSTDAEQQKLPTAKAKLRVTRTAPTIPRQRFSRADLLVCSKIKIFYKRFVNLFFICRVYRSVQPKSGVIFESPPAGMIDADSVDSVSISSSIPPADGDTVTSESVEVHCSASESEDGGGGDLGYSLEGMEKKAYLTAREIASSERVFVDCLRLICVDFRAAVTKASTANGSPIIPEVDLNKILSYLPHLQNLNQELLNDFDLRLSQWTTLPKICDVIVRKGPFLKLYSAYIRDFQSQSALLDECVQKYPRFGKTLKEFEISERCKCLSLKHYMLKPVQRLPQYRLLLDVYLRHLNESSMDYNDTVQALKVVTEVAEHANNSMKQEVIYCITT